MFVIIISSETDDHIIAFISQAPDAASFSLPLVLLGIQRAGCISGWRTCQALKLPEVGLFPLGY